MGAPTSCSTHRQPAAHAASDIESARPPASRRAAPRVTSRHADRPTPLRAAPDRRATREAPLLKARLPLPHAVAVKKGASGRAGPRRPATERQGRLWRAKPPPRKAKTTAAQGGVQSRYPNARPPAPLRMTPPLFAKRLEPKPSYETTPPPLKLAPPGKQVWSSGYGVSLTR